METDFQVLYCPVPKLNFNSSILELKLSPLPIISDNKLAVGVIFEAHNLLSANHDDLIVTRNSKLLNNLLRI